jgi:hypothetical protein
MTNPQERPELRASILDAFDKWDREVRRPARRRRITAVTVGVAVAVGCLCSGVMLVQNRPTEDLAVVTPPSPTPIPSNQPVTKELPGPEMPPVKPVPRVKPVTPKKSAPVFRGGEASVKIRLTPGAQCFQGSDVQPVSGVQNPVEVQFFTVSAGGETWKIGMTGEKALTMVSGNNGFILPTESGPVTILFSSPLTRGKALFGTKTGATTSEAATISIPSFPLKK